MHEPRSTSRVLAGGGQPSPVALRAEVRSMQGGSQSASEPWRRLQVRITAWRRARMKHANCMTGPAKGLGTYGTVRNPMRCNVQSASSIVRSEGPERCRWRCGGLYLIEGGGARLLARGQGEAAEHLTGRPGLAGEHRVALDVAGKQVVQALDDEPLDGKEALETGGGKLAGGARAEARHEPE